jgi:hypothetical protein
MLAAKEPMMLELTETPEALPAVLELLTASGPPHEGLAEHFEAALLQPTCCEPEAKADCCGTAAPVAASYGCQTR